MIELMEHQIKARDNLGNGKILWGGVGSGKSATVLAYYVKNEAPKDIYVITTPKKRDDLDWEGEAAKFGIGTERDGTLHGTLHVESWNNIRKLVDKENCFFIFDEQRVVGSGAWAKTFIKIARKNRWVLLSATPGDTWLDYIPVMVANNLYKNPTEFKREHVVYDRFRSFPKVSRYLGTKTLEKYRNMILVEMPYMKHTARLMEHVATEYDEDMYRLANVDRWNPYTDEPIKDVAELFRVSRKINGSDPSRLQALRKLMEKHPRIIVFYNFNYELDILRTLGEEIEVAEWNGHKKHPLPESDRWLYLVQYVAGAEGWNCITTDAMVFYSLTYSYKNFEQAQGRIDRLNTPYSTLYYYVLTAKNAMDFAVMKSLQDKKHFNEYEYALKSHLLSTDFPLKADVESLSNPVKSEQLLKDVKKAA